MSAARDQAFWLASKYLEGCIEEEELRRLEDLLRTSSEARMGFLNATHLHRQLKLVVEPSTSETAAPMKKPATRRTPPRRVRRTWFLPAVLAASLLVAVGLVLVLTPTRSGEEDAAREKAGREETSRRNPEEDRVRAEAHRTRAEEELAAVERERQRLAELEKRARLERQEEEERKAKDDLARIEAERKAIQERLDRAKEAQRRAQETVVQTGPPAPPVAPPVPAPAPTVSVEASLALAEGEILVVGKEGREGAKAGRSIFSGQGLATKGPKSRAVVTYSDGTQVEVGGDTSVTEIRGGGGKRVVIERGRVGAQVPRQPADQAMIFVTPHAEAKVLGTTLRILVEPDPKKGTRLEVEEGKVQLKRLADGKAVEVVTGHFAVAAAGVDLASKTLPFVEPPGLVVLWKFDEAGRVALDSSGKGHHGKIVGAARVPGVSGGALNFIAESNYVGLTSFDLGETFTIALWAKVPSADRVGDNLALISGEGWRFWVGKGWKTLNFETSGAGQASSNGDVFVFGEWNHVAVTVDRKAAKAVLYKDGVNVLGSCTLPKDFKVTGAVELGRSFPGANPFPGALDDVRIFNRVLTPQELVSLARRR